LGIKRSILPYLIFAGGITGLMTGIGLQYFVHVIEWPIIVGGRPHFSLPAFIPPAYELTILFAAFTAVFGMLFLNGLLGWAGLLVLHALVQRTLIGLALILLQALQLLLLVAVTTFILRATLIGLLARICLHALALRLQLLAFRIEALALGERLATRLLVGGGPLPRI